VSDMCWQFEDYHFTLSVIEIVVECAVIRTIL
jgi:hypothetical protein